jgi:bacteriocin-like protein
MNKDELKQITGGLSKPSKMPGFSYNLPATKCITGAKLVKDSRVRLLWMLCIKRKVPFSKR